MYKILFVPSESLCFPQFWIYKLDLQNAEESEIKLLTSIGIKIAGRNINNLTYADDTTLMAESEEELKSLLMKVKEESEKAGLKLNIISHVFPILYDYLI